jgi:hypothetical protein
MDPIPIPVPIPIIDLKYQLGKTYYIHSPSHPEAKFYIGSTKLTTKYRFTLHKSHYKRYLAGKPVSYCSSFEILKFGDAVIVKLEDYPCNNRPELELREKATIKCNRSRCVNIYTPAPTAEERKAYKQAYRQIYVICECGERVNKHNKLRHLKSQTHITAMANLTP